MYSGAEGTVLKRKRFLAQTLTGVRAPVGAARHCLKGYSAFAIRRGISRSLGVHAMRRELGFQRNAPRQLSLTRGPQPIK